MADVHDWNTDDGSLQSDDSTVKSSRTGVKRTKSQRSTSQATKRNIDKTGQGAQTSTSKRLGRKPLEKESIEEIAKDPKQKRKAQNRAAQRAFRERKEKFVAELQERIRQLEEENAQKDKDLVLENERLKEQLKQLQEENYALKGAQFTFEFPLNDVNEPSPSTTQESDITHMGQPRADVPASGDESSSSETSHSGQSPESYKDNSSSSMGHLPSPIPADHDFDFLTVPDTTNAFNLDMLAGKENLFSDYRIPLTDDLLFNADPLPPLFGTDVDLFGLSAPAPQPTQASQPTQVSQAVDDYLLDPSLLSTDIGTSTEQPSPCSDRKQEIYRELLEAKEKGMRHYDVMESLAPRYPDYNIDLLCSELKEKAQCSLSTTTMTGRDVDSFLKCFGAT